MTVILLAGCGRTVPKGEVRAVYHWKTTFNPTQYEWQWMKDHHVTRLYLRVFDVDVHATETAAPVATTKFLQLPPDDMEVVPVVYITNAAMREMGFANEWEFAEKVADRVMKMAECNGIDLREMQVDCDWTESTRWTYFWFCSSLRRYLNGQGVRLTSTVRLHQVDSSLADLEVDGTVLMLYNTGDFRSRETRNSILDHRDVEPYLRRFNHKRTKGMAVAWPVYGWGVAFDGEGRFSHLVHSSQLASDTSANVREEWGEVEEIAQVKRRLEPRMDHSGERVTILYHLDSLNLSKYTYDEIEQIYTR